MVQNNISKLHSLRYMDPVFSLVLNRRCRFVQLIDDGTGNGLRFKLADNNGEENVEHWHTAEELRPY